jgi:hypothetical protein
MTKLSSDPTISSAPAKSLRPFIAIVSCAVGCALLSPKIGSVYAEGRTYAFLGALFLVTVVAWRFPDVAAWSARHERLVGFLGAALLVMPLFGKDLQAEWGIIDDHEIMTYLGPRERLPIAEVPSLLMHMEVGQPGKSLRYRPAYYLLRLMETALWGKNCTLWYLARIVILIVSIALTWLLLRPSFGFVASALFLAYLISLQFWCDIFAKLGPAETYIVFGLAWFAYCAKKLTESPSVPDRRGDGWRWLGLSLGAAICIGSKENFVILIIPFAVVAVLAIRRRRFGICGTVSSLAILAMTGLVAGSVIIATGNAGYDIYGHRVGLSIMSANLAHSFAAHDCRVMLGILSTVAGALLFELWIKSDRAIIRLTGTTALCVGVCLALYSSQFVFYSGIWPVGNRYDFPGVLAPAFAWLFAARLGLLLLERARVGQNVTRGLRFGMMMGLCLVISENGYSAVRGGVAANVAATRRFKIQLTNTVNLLKADPEAALVIESTSVGDFEPIISYARFLSAYGVRNPLFLKLNGYAVDDRSRLDHQLSVYLVSLSANGGDGYRPMAELGARQGACYMLRISPGFENSCVRLR